MRSMKREITRRAIVFAAILGFTLAAFGFFAVRDFLAAFLLFSLVFMAIGVALLLVISAEEALVWGLRWTEDHLMRFRARHLVLAAHSHHANQPQER